MTANNPHDEKDERAKDPAIAAEAAADFIEGILDIADVDGDLEFGVNRDRPFVELPAGDCEALIGRDGQGIDALQLLTRLAVERKGLHPQRRLVIDIAGYRATQRQEIEAEAQEAIDHVLRTGDEISLRPMNPFERSAVHDLVSSIEGVNSMSRGVPPTRTIVLQPDGDRT